ncbi:hypothetical protein EON65_53370, partial [archaeon]
MSSLRHFVPSVIVAASRRVISPHSVFGTEQQRSVWSAKRLLSSNESKPPHPPKETSTPQPPDAPKPSTTPSPSAHQSHSFTESSTAFRKRLGDTIHLTEQKYEDWEHRVMSSLNESNRRRFRLYFYGTIVAILSVSGLYGEKIRKFFTEKTAGLAEVSINYFSVFDSLRMSR